MTTDKIVLVTAGASGIGRTISELFLSRGCQVHVCDIEQSHIDDFIEANPAASGTRADVAIAGDVEHVFSDLGNRHGRLDVLVNNAGVAGPTANIEDISPEEWNRTIAVNLGGQFLCSRLAVPFLKKSGGAIINIASNVAFTGCPYRAPYAASKWAVVGLTKTLAMELGKFAIRVNALCPCSVEGERIEAVLERDADRLGKSVDEVRSIYQRQSSLRQFVSPEDIAESTFFFASDAARNISGQVIGVDGHTESLANPFDD
jgi:NAD(P)-dependent dehydrogenase (short-subunit alcohol dehydrogenase family)